jgi:hypothetical protein
VLQYFLRNPKACDSVEGIARWRLLESVVDAMVTETHEALRRLVAKGVLAEENAPGMQTLYRLNRDRDTGATGAPRTAKRRGRSP